MSYLSCKEVASILRCNVTCVYALIHAGDIHSTKRGRNYLILSDDVDEYIRQNTKRLSPPFATAKNSFINGDKDEMVDMFLDGVRDMIENDEIIPVDIGSPPVTIVHRDEDFYYFDPDEIYRKVKRYYADAGVPFNMSKTLLYQLLVTEGITEGEIDRTTKAKCLNGSRPRKLWVRAEAIHNPIRRLDKVESVEEEVETMPDWMEEIKEAVKAEILAELGISKKLKRR